MRFRCVSASLGLSDARLLPSLFLDAAGALLKEITKVDLQAALAKTSATSYASAELLRLHERFLSAALPAVAAVDSRDFLVALSLFCSGTKSDKLAVAFEWYSDDGSGNPSRIGLWRLLRALLFALCAFQDSEQLWSRQVIDDAAAAGVQVAFSGSEIPVTGVSTRTHIDFVEFARVYNERVHAQLVWLEMLNADKWPLPPFCNEQPAADAEPLLICPLTGPQDLDSRHAQSQLVLTRDHVRRFIDMLAGVSLGHDALVSALSAEAYENDGLSEGGMLAALSACGFCDESSHAAALRCEFARSVFAVLVPGMGHAPDRLTSTARTPVLEVAAALSFLLQEGEGKSSKLLALWESLEENETTGALSRRSLWKLLRALLAALLVLSADEWPVGVDAARALHLAADAAAIEATASIFLHTESRACEDTLTLEEFADFYNDAAAGSLGVTGCSWLELLDSRKWELLLLRCNGAIQDQVAYRSKDTVGIIGGGASSMCVRAVLPCDFVFEISLAAKSSVSPLRLSHGACAWLERVSRGSGLADAPLGFIASTLEAQLGPSWTRAEVQSGASISSIVQVLCADINDNESCSSLDLFLRRFRAAAEIAGGNTVTGMDLWIALLTLTASGESKSRKLELAVSVLSHTLM